MSQTALLCMMLLGHTCGALANEPPNYYQDRSSCETKLRTVADQEKPKQLRACMIVKGWVPKTASN